MAERAGGCGESPEGRSGAFAEVSGEGTAAGGEEATAMARGGGGALTAAWPRLEGAERS